MNTIEQATKETSIFYRILNTLLLDSPNHTFLKNLFTWWNDKKQFSKKQMQALYNIACKRKNIPKNWIATLEAEIIRKPTKYHSENETYKVYKANDDKIVNVLESILSIAPFHKGALQMHYKVSKNVSLTLSEISQLKQMERVLLKK